MTRYPYTNSIAPKPCPFCAAEVPVFCNYQQRGEWWHYIACNKCYAQGRARQDQADALAHWNRRDYAGDGSHVRIPTSTQEAALMRTLADRYFEQRDKEQA